MNELDDHNTSGHQATTMVVFSKSGEPHSMIIWIPVIPIHCEEADWVSLSKLHFGESKIVTFPDLLGALGDRVKCAGSNSDDKKGYELPALDFKTEQGQQLKMKILALKSAV